MTHIDVSLMLNDDNNDELCHQQPALVFVIVLTYNIGGMTTRLPVWRIDADNIQPSR